MKILSVKYSPFSLKLQSAFRNSKNIIEHRKGFLIRVSDDEHPEFFGEVSPLPGFSRDDFESAEIQLQRLSSEGIKDTGFDSPAEIASFAGHLNLTPSVRFGTEQVLLNRFMMSNRNKLQFSHNPKIKVNAVIGLGETEDIKASVRKYLYEGFSTIKIKIGNKDFSEDLARVRMIRELCGGVQIRLDANGAWNFDDAVSHISELAKMQIELIEEPCRGISELAELYRISGVPVAADESIEDISELRRIIEKEKLPFAVVKPSVLGSPAEIMDLITLAEKHTVKLIISSAFESAVGKSMLVFLASLTDSGIAHGLNTSGFFAENICADPYSAVNGQINFDITNFPPDFNL